MTKLLITGASGLLGANLILEALDKYEVTALCHNHPIQCDEIEVLSADLTDQKLAHDVINDVSPDWVIHCAAETHVDRCERDPERAFLFNRDMPRWVTQATCQLGSRMIYISTDAVFEGLRSGYREDDLPQPRSVYGQSKLEGERVVLAEDPHAIVVRTNFYGWNAQDKNSLAEWFLSNLAQGKPCNGFIDVRAKLLLVNDLAEILLQLMELEVEGVLHVLGKDCISKYDFGVQLARVFRLDESLISPMEVEDLGLLAPRARNLCLDTGKLSEVLDRDLPSLEGGIQRFLALRDSGYRDRVKSLLGGQENERN
jgi:dTDP-4-dehydrorhamnose reductase